MHMTSDQFDITYRALFTNHADAARCLGIDQSCISRYRKGQAPVLGPVSRTLYILTNILPAERDRMLDRLRKPDALYDPLPPAVVELPALTGPNPFAQIEAEEGA